MRAHGTLTKWNDDRGFGFISPATGSDELFVHFSAFPRGSRPQVGEVISFETEIDPKGKVRAVRVMRPGSSQPARPQPRVTAREPGGFVSAVLGGAFFLALAIFAFDRFRKPVAATFNDASSIPRPASLTDSFSCDGRTMCSQMTSCAEAEYFLRHCPDTQMDGNGDGEPCEQQWCNEAH